MKIQTVPARRGALWVRQGFQIFFKRPLAFAALFATFMFGVLVLALLPFVGALLVLALLPLVSLAFMLATRAAMAGATPTARVFVEPLRGPTARRNAMIQLGVIYAVATFAVLWLSDVVDGGAFEALMDAMPGAKSSPDAVAAKLAAPGLGLGLLLRFGIAGLLAVPFWHAPALVHFEGQGCAQALFSSTLACWRNRGAFVVYMLVWAGLAMAFGIVASVLVALLGAPPELITVLLPPAVLMFSVVFYVSLYLMYADCFAAAAPPIRPSSP